MNLRNILIGGGLALLSFSLCGCIARHVRQWEEVDEAVAVIHPAGESEVTGAVHFYQLEDGVRVVADVQGLEPGSTHAIHVHEYGDCTSDDAASAGGHYNPSGAMHGLPSEDPRHAGDLGNLQADDEGNASYEITVHNLSVAELLHPVVGRAVVIHAGEDTGEQPAGGAGARIACGVIGVANPGK